jgi:hypothetical protein
MRFHALTLAFVALLAALPAAQATQTEAPADVIGEWDLTTLSPIGENTNRVEFRKDGDVIKAYAKGAQGERAYDATQIEGNKITLVITVMYENNPMVITYSGTVADASINGSADFGGMALGSFSAVRKPEEK